MTTDGRTDGPTDGLTPITGSRDAIASKNDDTDSDSKLWIRLLQENIVWNYIENISIHLFIINKYCLLYINTKIHDLYFKLGKGPQ